MTTVGEALVHRLKAEGVDVVFGIPGVHTIELYRGLAASGIRHVTPRHEQGAGFMADGYARVSGRPGVAFVITGPGLTNILTPMAQARAESVPMLVVCGVNPVKTRGGGLGLLHELPDQLALARQVAVQAEDVKTAAELAPALDRAFERLANGRPGPVLVEVPTDVMPLEAVEPAATQLHRSVPTTDVGEAADLLAQVRRPVILVGGGARAQSTQIHALAEQLDAPVVLTTNARGIMHGHPLVVPASPSLTSVRSLLQEADMVLAIGTELGLTDYDVYDLGAMPPLPQMVRIDVCAEQLQRHTAAVTLRARAEDALPALIQALPGAPARHDGSERAQRARADALRDLAEISGAYPELVAILGVLRDHLPGAVIVGDSTQAIYAGNLCYDHDRPGGWFNGATGFGALGFALPAAIGASIADPETPVIAFMGDGGAQFTLPELMVAAEENLPVLFVIWNNAAYKEIGDTMARAGISVVGCTPRPPDFRQIASACGMPYWHALPSRDAVAEALSAIGPVRGPTVLEIDARV